MHPPVTRMLPLDRRRTQRLLDQLGQFAQLDAVGVAGGLDCVLVHRHVLGAGDDEHLDVGEADGLADAVLRGPLLPGRVGDPDPPAAGAAAEAVVAVAGHLDERAAESLEDLARRVVAAVVAAEVAGIVVGDAVAQRAAPARAGPRSSSSSRKAVWWSDRPAAAERGVLVAQGVQRVRVAGHDPVELAARRRLDVLLGQRLEQPLLPPRAARRCRRCARRRRGSRSRRRRRGRSAPASARRAASADRTRRSRRRTRARRPAPCARP